MIVKIICFLSAIVSAYSFISSIRNVNAKIFRKVHMNTVTKYEDLQVATLKGIHFSDITPQLRKLISDSGVREGVITVISRHTTAAITINEMEARLVDDTRQFLLKLVPAAYPYLHNGSV